MPARTLVLASAFSVLLALGSVTRAADPEDILEGKVVCFGDNRLVIVDVKGKEHIHVIAPGTKIIIDGKEARADELRPGFQLRVALPRGIADRILRLDARRVVADNEAQTVSHEGRFVSAKGEKLIMTDKEGKEHTHVLAADATVIINDKVARLEDLKPNTMIRVFTTKDDKKVAHKIEAKSGQ